MEENKRFNLNEVMPKKEKATELPPKCECKDGLECLNCEDIDKCGRDESQKEE